MINVKELRIGNKIIAIGYDLIDGGRVENRKGDFQIDVDIEFLKSCINNPHYYEPIPLTPEWLERCGFVDGGPHDNGEHSWHHPDMTLSFDGKCFYYYDDNDCIYVGACNYLHQLQNFYFATEGEELNVKL